MSRRRITAALGAAAVTLILATGGAAGRAGGAPGQQAPADQTPPSISGSAVVANTLTASTGTWQGKGLKFAYQWLRCDSAGANCSAIGGAAGSAETLSVADVGSTLRVIVTASNRNGSTAATSAQTAAVATAASPPPPSSPPATTSVAPAESSLPVVSGTPQQNQTLSTSTGSWSGTTPMTYSYQWQRCDTGGGSCAPISGATAASYVLAATDVGSTLRASVTASNSAGSATASSDPTSVVNALSSSTGSSAATAGCNGCYFWWKADPLPGNWRTEPSPFNSTCFQQLSEANPFGSKVVRLHIGNLSCADTGWGEKSALNGYRHSDGNIEPNSHAYEGSNVWYRLAIRFPSTWVGSYGKGNVTAEWHSNSSNPNMPTGQYESFLGVSCDYGQNSCVNPRLALVERAGQMASSGSYAPAINRVDDVFSPNSLERNHWYDIVFHFVWSGTSSGQVQWWVDGKLVYQNLATPTLLVAPDGYVDEPDIDITNYRDKVISTPSDIDYAFAADGPTAASIGFSP